MSRKRFEFVPGAVFAKNTKVRQIILLSVDEDGVAFFVWRPLGEGPVREEARYDCMPRTFHKWAQADVSDFWPNEIAAVLDGSYKEADEIKVEVEADEADEDPYEETNPYDEDYLR